MSRPRREKSPANGSGQRLIVSTWARQSFVWREIPLAHEVADTAARLDGDVRFAGAADFGPASVVNMGNPHVIFFVADVANTRSKLGPGYETHPLFPEKTNVSFAQFFHPTVSG